MSISMQKQPFFSHHQINILWIIMTRLMVVVVGIEWGINSFLLIKIIIIKCILLIHSKHQRALFTFYLMFHSVNEYNIECHKYYRMPCHQYTNRCARICIVCASSLWVWVYELWQLRRNVKLNKADFINAFIYV